MTQALANLEVEVTQQDIDVSVPGSEQYCLVSTAIGRMMPGKATRIKANTEHVAFSIPEEGRRFVYDTPPEIRDYILKFDAGADFVPFRFILRSPLIVPIGKRTGAKRLIVKNVKTPSPGTGRYVRVRGERKFVGNQALSPTARAHVRP